MAAVNLRLEMLRGRAADPDDTNLDAAQQLTMQAMVRLRELLFELHPPALDEYGLVAALRAQLDQLAEDGGIRSRLRSSISQEPQASTRTVLFRIAQEAIHNIRKHADARRVEVDVRTSRGGTQIRIRDDGRGLPPEFGSTPPPGHMGLTVMRERARLAGGWWRIGSPARGGTEVEFWVPGPDPTSTSPDARQSVPLAGGSTASGRAAGRWDRR